MRSIFLYAYNFTTHIVIMWLLYISSNVRHSHIISSCRQLQGFLRQKHIFTACAPLKCPFSDAYKMFGLFHVKHVKHSDFL